MLNGDERQAHLKPVTVSDGGQLVCSPPTRGCSGPRCLCSGPWVTPAPGRRTQGGVGPCGEPDLPRDRGPDRRPWGHPGAARCRGRGRPPMAGTAGRGPTEAVLPVGGVTTTAAGQPKRVPAVQAAISSGRQRAGCEVVRTGGVRSQSYELPGDGVSRVQGHALDDPLCTSARSADSGGSGERIGPRTMQIRGPSSAVWRARCAGLRRCPGPGARIAAHANAGRLAAAVNARALAAVGEVRARAEDRRTPHHRHPSRASF